MFWKKKQAPTDEAEVEPSAFARYVVKKVIPRIKPGREVSLVEMAGNTFRRALPTEHIITGMLLDHGLDDAMMCAMTFADAIENTTDEALSDIEYADCYLCAVYCLAMDLRDTPKAASDALTEWVERFGTDLTYLVYDDEDRIEDLMERGWERYSHYHDHEEAILPRAYLHLLSQVVRQRRMGNDTPYADLDPMIMSDPMVLAALEQTWEARGRVFAQHWHRLVEQVKEAADEHDEEFWAE